MGGIYAIIFSTDRKKRINKKYYNFMDFIIL